MSSATIRDVAKFAEVSVATVSRVLNNPSTVSQVTRERVIEAIDSLSFTPNPVARRLSLGLTHSIAVILPLFTLPSYVERLRGVQHALASSGYDLILYNVDTPEQREDYYSSLTLRARVDGTLIISLPPSDSDADRFVQANVPTILIDAFHPKLSCVYVDDVDGGYRATKHLIDLGHRKIGFISDILDTPLEFGPMKNRFAGYRKALEEAAIPYDEMLHKEGPHGRHEAGLLAKGLLKMDEPPTAIFAASDTQAIGVIDSARDLGLNVPEDLSIIGYDGIRDAEYLNLTTMQQHLYNSGEVGTYLLLDVLKNNTPFYPPKQQKLPVDIVIRGTTAPLRA